MHYRDSIYGSAEINEPVLTDLIQSAAMQRLRGVLQHGITALIGVTPAITRFEHSLGVMLLTRRLGASLEEQIAALLHDVSHTAFSHVIDYVFDSHNDQSYHEEKKEEYMAGSDLPARLAAHGYDWRNFLREDDYSLLERPAPALCADRLDYFLRDCCHMGLGTPAGISAVLNELVVREGRIAVRNIAAARWLAYTYIAADQASWANFREVGLYELTARAIKTGMGLGIISDADLWGTDMPLWEKLRAGDDPMLRQQVKLVSPDTRFLRDERAPTFCVGTKLRTIDPDVPSDGHLRPLSAIDPDFAQYRSEYLSSKQGLWPMRVLALDVAPVA